MTSYEVILSVLALLMVAGGIGVITAKSLISAVILEGVVSLLAALLFFAMAAPDVAITQAVIGAGLTTAIFLWTLRRLQELREQEAGHE